jgi:hypothetical protein
MSVEEYPFLKQAFFDDATALLNVINKLLEIKNNKKHLHFHKSAFYCPVPNNKENREILGVLINDIDALVDFSKTIQDYVLDGSIELAVLHHIHLRSYRAFKHLRFSEKEDCFFVNPTDKIPLGRLGS